MADTTYNGWTNYETWCVNLWIDNSAGDQDYWHDRAKWCIRHHHSADDNLDARCELAEELRATFDEKYDEQKPDNGVLADLLRAALSEVNWHEIARHYIEAIEEEANA
jgi:hypothetical protein